MRMTSKGRSFLDLTLIFIHLNRFGEEAEDGKIAKRRDLTDDNRYLQTREES